ncbi:MAG: hypothetical protein PHE30_02880 [Candidatus Omnitrophica bacterium]|nr:hypothetical protein [Candidatus Omnitrophota bacterium]MDD5026905.1 hypothetical protein [Candidatus Omnitrophota bacterium]MDD5662187.1 hypothetical protein [Candidatus Omnitrophota bacterium]
MKNKSILFLAAVFFLFLGIALSPAYGDDAPALLVFHSPTCQRCLKVKKEIIPRIEAEFKGRIRIEYRDIADIKDYVSMLGLKEKYDKDIVLELPVFFMNGKLLNGTGDVQANLKGLINASLEEGPEKAGVILGADLVGRFKDIRPVAVFGAGLTDGINPCAFTVIVFFISYLAFQGYRKLELVIVGSFFIFTVFLTYFLIGLGIFNFLYRLEGFWVLTKIFNVSIGVFSLVLGILAIYDLLRFSRTQDAEGQLLQLPKAVKNQIHSVIGRRYRKAKEGDGQKRSLLGLARLVLGTLITGFLVSILEAVCTGQLYLPTLAFILKTTPLKAKALTYLVIYNVMFVIPLFIIFLLALLGVTSSSFSQFVRKHLAGVKLLMAVIFISLGIFLVWRG